MKLADINKILDEHPNAVFTVGSFFDPMIIEPPVKKYDLYTRCESWKVQGQRLYYYPDGRDIGVGTKCLYSLSQIKHMVAPSIDEWAHNQAASVEAMAESARLKEFEHKYRMQAVETLGDSDGIRDLLLRVLNIKPSDISCGLDGMIEVLINPCDLVELVNEEVDKLHLDPIPDGEPNCTECGGCLRLTEGGYQREWWLRRHYGEILAKTIRSTHAFSDDGDGNYRVECSICLKEYATPDEWDWN